MRSCNVVPVGVLLYFYVCEFLRPFFPVLAAVFVRVIVLLFLQCFWICCGFQTRLLSTATSTTITAAAAAAADAPSASAGGATELTNAAVGLLFSFRLCFPRFLFCFFLYSRKYLVSIC